MGVFTEAVADVRGIFEKNATSWSGLGRFIEGRAALRDTSYNTYAREGYMTNALVFACIEELGSSASEPKMHAKQSGAWRQHGDGGSTAANRLLDLFYGQKRFNGSTYYGVNPFMDVYEFWRTVILHRSIAGNAYALKVRSQSGRVVELWLMRPDRVTIVPDATNFIRRYEYTPDGASPVPLAPSDVIHWKTPHPLNDFYGMPPLQAIASNVDLDNYSRDFVKRYFEKAGVPSGILTTKGRMSDEIKEEIKARFSADYAGSTGWHGLLVLEQSESSYTQLTQSLGAQGLVLPELNQISEARICGAFGVPLSLVGTVVGTEASSYGNKKSEREGFWNETLKPLYRELAGPLNRSLRPEFPGVEEIDFNLATVGALQPDQDTLHARVRADVAGGLISVEEGRGEIGYATDLPAGHTFYIPSNFTQTPSESVGEAVQVPVPVGA